MNEAIPKKWAAIFANPEFVCVQTYSGFRSSASDPFGKLIFLPPTPTPHELGTALEEALLASRMLAPEEVSEFFDVTAVEKRYEDWVASIINEFSYPTRAQLFKHMKHCQVVCSSGTIEIRPTFHEKTEAWSAKGIEQTDHVLLAETVSMNDLGEAALLALSRSVSR